MFILFVILGTESRALHMPGKCSITKVFLLYQYCSVLLLFSSIIKTYRAGSIHLLPAVSVSPFSLVPGGCSIITSEIKHCQEIIYVTGLLS